MRSLPPLLRLQLLPLGHEVLPGDGAGRRGGPVQLRQLVDAAAGGEAVGGGVLRASTCNCSLYLRAISGGGAVTWAGAGVEAGVAQEAGRGRHGRQLEGPPVGRLHHHVADAAGQARAWDKVAYTCIYTYLLLLPHYPQCPVPTKLLKWREGLGSVLLRQHVRPGPGRGEAVGGGQLGGVRPPRLHAARGEGLGHLRDHRLQKAGGQGG